MKFKSDLKAVISANRMTTSVWMLLHLIDNLNIYTHPDITFPSKIVSDFVDQYVERRYQAYLEIFKDDGINKT